MTEELVSQGCANPDAGSRGGPRRMHAQCMATFECVPIQTQPELPCLSSVFLNLVRGYHRLPPVCLL